MVEHQSTYAKSCEVTQYDCSKEYDCAQATAQEQSQDQCDNEQNDWNDYVILANNNRIRLFINGHKSVDYLESDISIPLSGLIGL